MGCTTAHTVPATAPVAWAAPRSSTDPAGSDVSVHEAPPSDVVHNASPYAQPLSLSAKRMLKMTRVLLSMVIVAACGAATSVKWLPPSVVCTIAVHDSCAHRCVPSTQNVFVLIAETDNGENVVGTADPGLGYVVGIAGATLGTADDGGDARALDGAMAGDEGAPGDSLEGKCDGSGTAVGVTDPTGVRLLAVAVEPLPPPEFKPIAPATTAITTTAPRAAAAERRC
jgi:hypothetical protein